MSRLRSPRVRATPEVRRVRLFVALDIPEAVRASLIELAGELRKISPHTRWVRLERAHITLKFIGEAPLAQAEKIRAALGNIRNIAPFELRFAGLGFFPDTRQPRVFWAGIEGGASLAQLAAAIEDALAPLGIPRESREFRPHITLARLDTDAETASLHSAIAGHGTAEFGRARADEFCLYQSILKSDGAEYTRLAVYPLLGKQATGELSP